MEWKIISICPSCPKFSIGHPVVVFKPSGFPLNTLQEWWRCCYFETTIICPHVLYHILCVSISCKNFSTETWLMSRKAFIGDTLKYRKPLFKLYWRTTLQVIYNIPSRLSIAHRLIKALRDVSYVFFTTLRCSYKMASEIGVQGFKESQKM